MESIIKSNEQQEKIKTVGVIGIGRVGLPLALILASCGFRVFGIGRNEERITQINKGKMPFLEEGAKQLLGKVRKKNFFATNDYSCIADCDFIIMTLGTPIDENMNPVFDQINDALSSMEKFLRKGQTLILRSTVSPGTTHLVSATIESLTSFCVGENFFVAFCPERIAEGRALHEIGTIPQMIGGVDRKSSLMAQQIFAAIGVKTVISDAMSCELAKLFTNMYRYINFAIANEFMVLADFYKKDIYEILHLVNFGYTRGGVSLPGLTAGPCLFKDGFFMVSELPFTDLFLTSWKINEAVPLFLVRKLKELSPLPGRRVALLGLAFKAEIDDIRASLSFKIRKILIKERMNVILHDPYVLEYANQPVLSDVYEALKRVDVIFVGTNHKEYRLLNMKRVLKLVKANCIVCDVWNVFGTGKIVFPLHDFFSISSKRNNNRKKAK